jgi:hypothetical protein
VVGHYSRPDVFQLVVDETRRTPVSFRNAAPIDAVPAFASEDPQMPSGRMPDR